MLIVSELHSYYGRAHILQGVSLEVRSAEVVVLIGRNGAGKSTTMKSLIGLVPAASGSVTFDGAEISGEAPNRIARRGVGYVPEDRRIFTGLSVMENLEVGRQPPRGGRAAWTPERVFELFPSLGPMSDRLGGRMSGGEQQMLAIARTLMGNPSVILLDEPSEGLAPIIVEQMADAILALKREGVAVLLAEQNLHFASRVADGAVVIESGRVVWRGSMAALESDRAARERYLGL